MFIGSCEMMFNADFSHSLKEKRMLVRSIIDKTKHKFNVSIAETDLMDTHNVIAIGFCVVSNSKTHAETMMDHICAFIEENTDAVVINISKDVY